MIPDLPQTEMAIVELTNAFRAEVSRPAVRRSRVLDDVARSYARYLARTGKFSHTADGRKPAERATAGRYAFCQIAENLALNRDDRGFQTRQLATAAVEGWKNSPGHRRNMLLPLVTEIGVGVAKTPDLSQYISVQLFGRPRELMFQFKVRNESRTNVSYTYAGETVRLPSRSETRTTTCRPDKITFAVGGQSISFETERDAMFLVKPGSSGKPTVQQVPRVN